MSKAAGISWVLLLAALIGASGVGLGAYGAHGLEAQLARFPDADAAWITKRLDQFDVGVRYQMLHAVALLAIGCGTQISGVARTIVVTSWMIGVLVFSGLLYLLVLTNTPWLGAIVPIGGVAYIVGWLALLGNART